MIEVTKQYAIKCHQETNHLYDGHPYVFHLNMVYEEALFFSYLVPETDRELFLAGAWVHDVIEDCRQSYHDVKSYTCEAVAALAYALTTEKGKNRKERANAKYYNEMKRIPFAVLLKVCDRIANLKYSIKTESRMAELYVRENETFISALNDGSCDDAFKALILLCDDWSNRQGRN